MRRFAAAPLVSVAVLMLGLLLAPSPAAAAPSASTASSAQTAHGPLAGAAKRRAKAPRQRHRRCSPAGIRAVRGTARVERRVRCLLNRHRARVGLPPLRYDRCLDRSAERHARDMVARRFFAHSSRGGRTLAQRARRAGYVARGLRWRVGENLAWGAGRRGSARAAVDGWLRSPPHRGNIFAGGFRDIGVAVVHGAPVKRANSSRDRRAATFVVEFGARSAGRCR